MGAGTRALADSRQPTDATQLLSADDPDGLTCVVPRSCMRTDSVADLRVSSPAAHPPAGPHWRWRVSSLSPFGKGGLEFE